MSWNSRTDDAGFDRVVSYVADTVDFEPDYYNDDYLGRRVTARMRRRDTDTYDAYLDPSFETVDKRRRIYRKE